MKPQHHISTVLSRRWERDDDYNVVETQVFDIPARTPVRITVTPLTEEEYMDYRMGRTDASGEKKTHDE